MATIGTLSVSLKAHTEKFQRGMRGARRSLSRFSKAIPGVNVAVAGLGAALSAGALTMFVKRSMDAIDTVGKLSDRLNIATESLVGYQHAARITGLEGDALNKGFEVFARRLGEANQGLGEGKRVLDQLGLDPARLAAMDLGDAFEEVAGSFEQLSTQADKAAAANALFGRSGVRLINMLDLGRDGIRGLRQEAEDLGLTFSRVDAAKVEAANDALTRVRAVVAGIGQTMAIELAPMIQMAAEQFVEWGQEGEGWGGKVRSATRTVVNVAAKLTDVFNILHGTFKLFQSAVVLGMVNIGRAIALFLRSLEQMVSIVTFGLADVDFGAQATEEVVEGLGETMNKWASEGARLIKSGFAGEASDEARRRMYELEQAAEDIAKGLERSRDAMRGLASAGAGAAGAASDAAKTPQQRAMEALARERGLVLERYNNALRQMTPHYEWVSSELGHHIGLYDQLIEQGLFKEAELLWKSVAEYEKRLELTEQQNEAEQAVVDSLEKWGEMGKRAAVQEKKRAAEQKKSLDQYDLIIRKLEAGNEEELRAIENAERRKQIVTELGEVVGNQVADKMEAAEAAKRMREEEERAAAAVKDQADQEERKVRAKRKDVDITKKFANLGGSMFGFGAGRVFSEFGAGFSTKPSMPKAPASIAGGASVAGQAFEVKDPSPAVKQLSKAFAQLRTVWDRLSKAIEMHSKSVTSDIDRIGKSVTATVRQLSDAVARNTTRINKLEKDLAAAAAAGVAGQ